MAEMATHPIARDEASGGTPLGIDAGLGERDRKNARRALSVLAVLGTGGLIGFLSSLYLVNHHPLLLIALSPIGRHLILVAPIVDPFAFVAVAVGRRMLFYLASFQLGKALGPAGIVWLESRAERAGRFVRWIEGLFRRASHAVVFLMPGPTVSTLAGTSGMPFPRFVALVALGLTLRVILLLAFAEWLREPILAVLGFIDQHWIPGTLLLVGAAVAYQWQRRRSRRRRGLPASRLFDFARERGEA
ncbi:MAG: hypothetical protein V3U03_06960 [Myxococcota bacterium]